MFSLRFELIDKQAAKMSSFPLKLSLRDGGSATIIFKDEETRQVSMNNLQLLGGVNTNDIRRVEATECIDTTTKVYHSFHNGKMTTRIVNAGFTPPTGEPEPSTHHTSDVPRGDDAPQSCAQRNGADPSSRLQ